MPLQSITEAELRSTLDGFNIDGKHVMDTLPRNFVGIRHTHSNTNDPIALTVSQPEKREFHFPGAAAGTTRLVSKVARRGGAVEALECYGFDDTDTDRKTERLLITLMRRVDARDQEAKVVDVIIRWGNQINHRHVTVPAGAGVVIPFSQVLK